MMPSSWLLLAGAAVALVAVALLWAAIQLRREVDEARRLLARARVAVDEVERVDRARRQLADGISLARDGATGATKVVLRSGQAIAGIPYAILDGIGRRRRGDEPA